MALACEEDSQGFLNRSKNASRLIGDHWGVMLFKVKICQVLLKLFGTRADIASHEQKVSGFKMASRGSLWEESSEGHIDR